jgi:hypothetical protein
MGAKPAGLPVRTPTKFNPIINLKTASALALEIPPALFGLTDQVIDQECYSLQRMRPVMTRRGPVGTSAMWSLEGGKPTLSRPRSGNPVYEFTAWRRNTLRGNDADAAQTPLGTGLILGW